MFFFSPSLLNSRDLYLPKRKKKKFDISIGVLLR